MTIEMQNFDQDILKPSYNKPIVVDFWAEWCGPCRILGPVLEKLAARANGSWQLAKLNVDQHQALAQKFKIKGIPAVKMISEGRIIAEFTGALPESQIRTWLEKNLPTNEKKLLDSAKRAITAADFHYAEQLLREIIKEEPTNSEARVLLASLLFEDDLPAAADLVQNIEETDPFFNTANSIRILNRLIESRVNLAQQAQQQPALKAAWNDYLTGIDALKTKNYEQALKSWIDVIMVSRQLDEDGARKACVALFHLLGQAHELTLKYHRQFTMALY